VSPRRLAFAASLAGAVLFFPCAAAATDPSSEDTPAMQAYRRGSALLQSGQPAKALEELESSMQNLPSPNTELLIAHALRDLGRKAEAMNHYTEVSAAAAARVRAGEDRYGPTLADANRQIAALRGSLAELVVVIERAPAGIEISVDGVPAKTAFDAAAATMRAHVWHDRGHAAIAIRAPSGTIEHASAELTAGGTSEVRLVFVRDASGPVVKESVVREGKRSAAPPTATLVAGGVGAVALGMFAGFGLDANAAANQLKECSPHCGMNDQGIADRGSRSAAIANVSVVVAAAALATAGVVWIVSARRRPDTATLAAPGFRF
jgi:hypothetical protein